ncbi:MAG TPA: GDP-mannose 4,6-dehydratase [Nitrospirales bacterium]|jgi:GDPmannose 4,6-dehydratase|nr:GDP-mannose 4,6-dehydratase [Nitrospirales bacterium]
MRKRAIITGVTGQDGSYLAELLLFKGYEVHGLVRRASTFNTHRIDHIYVDPHAPGARFFLHYGDLGSAGEIAKLIQDVKPNELYHLAAQSHVRVSFDMPEYTGEITGIGATRVLEAVRQSKLPLRYYQASSSEMFGATPPPQNETTPFHPRSPYAAAKAYAYWMTINYREAYGLFAANGILFNHESPRRGETFVSRKVTRGVAAIVAKRADKLFLGNLDAKRDWGYAPEYVECMWRILQAESPEDFVIGTGETHSVRELVETAFGYVNLDWKKHIERDPRYLRPSEVDGLQADASKARKSLGWTPRVRFMDLVKIMVDCDLELMGCKPVGEGKKILGAAGVDWTTNRMTTG